MTKTKPKPKPWEVGDALVVDGTRWGITLIVGDDVTLKALSTTNHGMAWKTKIDKLPEKRA